MLGDCNICVSELKILNINNANNCISHVRLITRRADSEGPVLPPGMSISDERERWENDKQKERDKGRERGTRKLLRRRGERGGRNEVSVMAEGDRESTARPKKRHTTAVFQYFKRTPGYRTYHGQTFNIWSEGSTRSAQVFGIFESLYSISSDLFRRFLAL